MMKPGDYIPADLVTSEAQLKAIRHCLDAWGYDVEEYGVWHEPNPFDCLRISRLGVVLWGLIPIEGNPWTPTEIFQACGDWIPWSGGPQPVESGVRVDIRTSHGQKDGGEAEAFRWDTGHGDVGVHIASFRVLNETIATPPELDAVQEEMDAVHHPAHYTQAEGIECIDAIEAACADKTGPEAALVAPVIKYVWRYRAKGGAESLRKARWYLDRLIERVESKP